MTYIIDFKASQCSTQCIGQSRPIEWSGRVLLGARDGRIDSPKDPSHKTPASPPRARSGRPELEPGPIPTHPDQFELAQGSIAACWG